MTTNKLKLFVDYIYGIPTKIKEFIAVMKFILTMKLEVTLKERVFLINKIYMINKFVDCPHTQQEVL